MLDRHGLGSSRDLGREGIPTQPLHTMAAVLDLARLRTHVGDDPQFMGRTVPDFHGQQHPPRRGAEAGGRCREPLPAEGPGPQIERGRRQRPAPSTSRTCRWRWNTRLRLRPPPPPPPSRNWSAWWTRSARHWLNAPVSSRCIFHERGRRQHGSAAAAAAGGG